jgi:hypothetical protein
MVLTNLILAAIVVLMAGAMALGIVKVLRTYQRYRGQRLVTCPETHRAAAVHVNAMKAAREALAGREEIRLDQCSRWPEKRNCGQECLSQVNADPANCLVWNIVADWYKGKFCAYCQQPFTDLHWHEHYPALLSPDRIAKQWNEIPAETLPQVFETHLPVCWNCYIAETFRRQNPDRVLDRTWVRGAGGEYVPKEKDSPKTKATGTNG